MQVKIFIVGFLVMLVSCREEQQPDPVSIKKQKVDSLMRANPYMMDSYCNTRFTYCLNYPVLLMFPLPEATNGDGRIFNNKDGREVMRVFARPLSPSNKDWLTIQRVLEYDVQQLSDNNNSDQLNIATQKAYTTHYIITGTTPGRVFHQKALLHSNSIVYLILQYEPSESVIFEPVVDTILSSLK